MEGGLEAPKLVTKSLVPSPETATDDQGSASPEGNVGAQVLPKSAEVKTACEGDTTASVAPSADEATKVNSPKTVSLATQVAPELVELQSGSLVTPLLTATTLLPSAEQATENQKLLGALV